MRISKYPYMAGVGADTHLATPAPPATPPVPAPSFGWVATLCNPASALIYGKFTSQCTSEAMFDILFGHDWGIMQPHIALPPYTASPSTPMVLMGSSHKFFLPAYSTQETPTGGALSLIGAGATAVAISTEAFLICVQDCIDVGGGPCGLVAPSGMSFQPVSTRWVNFTLADLLAGVVAMVGDAVSAAWSSKLGSALSEGMSQAGQAATGVILNVANTAFQNIAGVTSDKGAQAGLGLAGVFGVFSGPGGVGILAGLASNAVGESGWKDISLSSPPPGAVVAGPDGSPIQTPAAPPPSASSSGSGGTGGSSAPGGSGSGGSGGGGSGSGGGGDSSGSGGGGSGGGGSGGGSSDGGAPPGGGGGGAGSGSESGTPDGGTS